MTYDHSATGLHRAELDREIDALRLERMLAEGAADRPSPIARLRRHVGRLLIATGTKLARDDRPMLRTRRA